MTAKFNVQLIKVMKGNNIDKFIQETIDNIRGDREVTKELLDDAIKWLAKDESRHREIGLTLAKYVETLQRSNEQLVKVVTLISKDTSSKSLSDEDKNDLLDIISKEGSIDEASAKWKVPREEIDSFVSEIAAIRG